MARLTPQDTQDFAKSLITETEFEKLQTTKNLDFSFSFANRRFRGNISFQLGNYMVILRLLNSEIPELDILGLPDIYKEVTKK